VHGKNILHLTGIGILALCNTYIHIYHQILVSSELRVKHITTNTRTLTYV